jgi:hypothetical protein
MFTKTGSGQISGKGGQVVRTAAAAGAFQQQSGEDFDRLAPKRIPLLCSQLLVQPAFRPQCVCELGCGLHSYLMQEKKTDSRVFQPKLRVHESRNAAYLDCNQVRKRHFFRHLYIKCIILPRQARDKHRENSKKVPFLEGVSHSIFLVLFFSFRKENIRIHPNSQT